MSHNIVTEHESNDPLVNAITRIAYGPISGPTGLEAVSMALSGEGSPGDNSIYDGLDRIGNALYALVRTQDEKEIEPNVYTGLNEIAESISDLAAAVREHTAATTTKE